MPCVFSQQMREKYRWAAAVPGRPEQAKCSLDGKLISVRNGAIQLGQHEKSQILLNQMSAASHLYKESEKQRMKEEDKLKVKSNELRRQIGIYQRRSSKSSSANCQKQKKNWQKPKKSFKISRRLNGLKGVSIHLQI